MLRAPTTTTQSFSEGLSLAGPRTLLVICAILAAVSAPSDLAVEAADRLGQTLVGFLRGDGFNVYAHPERVLI